MKNKFIRIIISFIIFIFANFISSDLDILRAFLFVISYFIIGFDILKKALRNITKGKIFDENFLMALATIGAFAIKEYPEAVAVMLFYQVGELFQSYAVDKSRQSISKLMDIRADYANVYRNKEIECVDPYDVKVGEIIVVKPGEKIPLDGKIVEGESNIDTKALTGESVPRHVFIKESVLSGCINLDSVIKIKVDKEYDESTVNKILELVENASNRKSKSESFITKFAKIYTPAVVFIATFIAIVPPVIVASYDFTTWLYRALSFLVVSCPCALVISIPLSFFSGIGASAKIGVLIKGSNYLEALANAEIIVCDKTGTLTEGEFKVQKIDAVGYSESEILKYAAHAELFSNHPISLSVKQAYKNSIDEKLVTETEEIPGKGIIAKVDGKHVLIGNENLLKDYHIKFKENKDKGTILYMAINKKFVGTIILADQIKEDAYKAIKLYKDNNIKRVVMLTGDREEISVEVANKLKLDEYHAELLPQDKVSWVEKLMSQKSSNGKLIFVGDGINDAPVLALCDIGVAMGGLGSDAAVEAADIIIMTDEPSKIASSINISKQTMRIVKENIIFAIGVKIAVLILSAFGISTMWEAVFADVGVSILAILNALRIMYISKRIS